MDLTRVQSTSSNSTASLETPSTAPTPETERSRRVSPAPGSPPNVTAFIHTFEPYAAEVEQTYQIPASVTLAQAALETGWGSRAPHNAYFGIKPGQGWTGETQNFGTHEFSNGNRTAQTDSFRAYRTARESFLDYGRFLTNNGRYRSAFSHTDNPNKFIDEIAKATYATDPEYAAKLKRIVSRYLRTESVTQRQE